MTHFNPFPGLRPFESTEDYLFFGRDGQSDELLRRLSLRRFLAVIGTSGSGKSSLVRAGLLPALYGGFMLNAGSTWRIALFRPGTDPIGHLAGALSEPSALGSDNGSPAIHERLSETTLRRSSLGLVDLVRHAKRLANENLLIVVDQFEEIFRFKQNGADQLSADDAAAFVKLLLEATGQVEVPIYVVITMRSDFLGDCAQFRDLPEAINDGQYLIPRMTRDQRRAAITGPIAVGGAEIAPRLVNRLLNDVGDDPDQLPILQHALMRTWQTWLKGEGKEPAIDFGHYEAVGGMAQALSQHADKAFHDLRDDRLRKIAEKLFKCLTERGMDNREVRRPTTLNEICAVAEATEAEVVEVIEAFRRPGRSFLMPPAGIALTRETLIDISHESLIRGWQRLKGWVEEEAQSARTYRRLADHAVLYDQGEAALWHDPNLRIALDWRKQNNPNEMWGRRYDPNFAVAMRFLEKSKEKSDDEIAAIETQRRREIRRTRWVAAVVGLAFLISTAAAVYAFRKNNEASKARQVAEDKTRIAEEQTRRATEEERKAQQSLEALQIAKADLEDSYRQVEKQRALAEQRAEQAKVAEQIALQHKRRAEQQTKIAKESLAETIKAKAAALNVAVHKKNADFGKNSAELRLADKLLEVSTPSEALMWHVTRAQALSGLGRHSEVVDEYSRILAMEPNFPEALMNRGYTYTVVNGDDEAASKAIRDLDAYLAMDKNSALAYQNKAIALGQMGDYKGAKSSISKAIEVFKRRSSEPFTDNEVSPQIKLATGFDLIVAHEPAFLTALHYHLATLQAFQGQTQFFESLKETERKRPKSVDAYLSALNWAWLHQKKRPEDYGGLVSEGALWEQAGYPEEARHSYEEFLRRYEQQPDKRYDTLANWVRQEKRKPQFRAGRKETQDVRTLALKAAAWEKVNPEYAEQLLTQALEQEPENVDLLLQRALLRNRLKKFPESGADADKAQRLEPDAPLVLLYRGLATGDVMARKADFRRALDSHPLHFEILFRLSELEEKDNPAEAFSLIERALKVNPMFAPSYHRKAVLLNNSQDHEGALKSIQKAIEIDKSERTFYDERAKIEKDSRKVKPETILINWATGYRDAADALLRQGRPDEALEAYKESLNLLAGPTTREDPNVKALMTKTMRQIAVIAERAGGSKAKAIEYLKTRFADRPELRTLLKSEIDRLSSSP